MNSLAHDYAHPVNQSTNHHPAQQTAAPFTRVPNALLESMALAECFNREARVFLFLLRQTHGWHRDGWQGTVTEIARGTGIAKRTVQRALATLKAQGLVRADQGDGANHYSVASAPPPIATPVVMGGGDKGCHPFIKERKISKKKTLPVTNFNGLEAGGSGREKKNGTDQNQKPATASAELPDAAGIDSQNQRHQLEEKPKTEGKPSEAEKPLQGRERLSAPPPPKLTPRVLGGFAQLLILEGNAPPAARDARRKQLAAFVAKHGPAKIEIALAATLKARPALPWQYFASIITGRARKPRRETTGGDAAMLRKYGCILPPGMDANHPRAIEMAKEHAKAVAEAKDQLLRQAREQTKRRLALEVGS